MKYPRNVIRGAELLDETCPGWEAEIDTAALDQGNDCNCVLGQLYGDYAQGVDVLGLSSPGRYGFLTWGRQWYRDLTAAWRQLIVERRQAS